MTSFFRFGVPVFVLTFFTLSSVISSVEAGDSAMGKGISVTVGLKDADIVGSQQYGRLHPFSEAIQGPVMPVQDRLRLGHSEGR